jgi:hypothetical protein
MRRLDGSIPKHDKLGEFLFSKGIPQLGETVDSCSGVLTL